MIHTASCTDTGHGRTGSAKLGPVSMVFGPDDDVEFASARDSLLESFELWLAEKRSGAEADEADAAEMAGDAGLALDWKWSYGDGDLGRWRTGDVGEFLLEWCPRKLSVSQADCVSIPAALATFTAFLEARGCWRRARRPSPPWPRRQPR